jgi:hypothetical protein
VTELTIEEKAKLNGVYHGDKTLPLTVAEMDYCFKRLRNERLPNAEIAKKLGVPLHDVVRWVVAGRALEGRGGAKPPTGDEELPQTISEKLGVKAQSRPQAERPITGAAVAEQVGPPPKVESINSDHSEWADPTPHPVLGDPLVVAAMEVRRTATVCA